MRVDWQRVVCESDDAVGTVFGMRPAARLGADVNLPPPPRERRWEAVRRWWRSQGRHRGLRYWLVYRGSPFILGFGGLFVANGLMIGWRDAYDVALAITSPAATSSPVLAWFLSVAGWLLAPGLAGAVAGHVISTSITSRRSRPIDRVFPSADDD